MRNQIRLMSVAVLGVALGALPACDDDDATESPTDGSSLSDAASDAGAGGQSGNMDASVSDGPATDGSPQDGGAVATVLALGGTANTSFLTTFPANAPQMASSPVLVTGLAPAEVLLRITVRPANGKVYGLGSTSRLYEINRATGAATALGTAAFTPALMGIHYGFDFNPVVDRIRLVSDAEQNLRLHPDTGVVAATDPNLNPAGSVGPVAYTNTAGATVTTLFGLDYAANSLVRIGGPDGMPNPNEGLISVVGPTGVDVGEPASLDIAPNNMAYAAWQNAGVSKLYMVNLTTGAATEVGAIGGTMGAIMVRAIAVLP